MDKEYGTLTKTAVLFAGANIAGKLLKVIIVPLYTYYMTSAQFGTAETISVTAGLICLVIASGSNEAAIRFSMDDRYNADDVASNCFALIAMGAVPGLLICLPLSRFDTFSGHIPLLCLLVITGAAEGFAVSLAKGFGRNRVYAVSEIISAMALMISCMIFLVLMKAGLEGYIWSRIIAFAVRIAYIDHRVMIHKSLKIGTVRKDLMIPIARFASPLTLSALLWWIMDQADRYIIMWLLGASSVGIYAIACRISSALASLNVIFHQAWQLSAIRRFFKGDFNEFYKEVFSAYSAVFFAAAAFIIAVIRPLIHLLDESYEDAWMYAPFLLIAAVFMGLSSFTGVSYTVTGKTTGDLITSFIGALINVVSALILTMYFGLQGAAIATLISYYAFWMVRTLHIKMQFGISAGTVIVHLDLMIVLTEAMCVLTGRSAIMVVFCLAALAAVNTTTIRKMSTLLISLSGNIKK